MRFNPDCSVVKVSFKTVDVVEDDFQFDCYYVDTADGITKLCGQCHRNPSAFHDCQEYEKADDLDQIIAAREKFLIKSDYDSSNDWSGLDYLEWDGLNNGYDVPNNSPITEFANVYEVGVESQKEEREENDRPSCVYANISEENCSPTLPDEDFLYSICSGDVTEDEEGDITEDEEEKENEEDNDM